MASMEKQMEAKRKDSWEEGKEEGEEEEEEEEEVSRRKEAARKNRLLGSKEAECLSSRNQASWNSSKSKLGKSV